MRTHLTVLLVCVVGAAEAGPPGGGGRALRPAAAPPPQANFAPRGYPVQRGSNYVPSGIGRPLTGGASGINAGAYRSGGGYHSGNRYENRRYNYLPSTWWLTPYYYPFAGSYLDTFGNDYGGYGPAAAPQYGQDPAIADLGAGQNELGSQVQRLAEEVDHLRSRQIAPAEPLAAAPPQPPAAPLTLVLRSGAQLEVQNYAVMDRTFWDFSAQPVKKIPISSIDVDASIKMTEARGGEFPSLPSAP